MDALRKAREHLASLPFTAAGLVGRKVKVIFKQGESTASTNGQVITLPALPLPSSEKDIAAAEELRTIALGYIHHEAGHCITTDFAAGIEWRKEAPINHALFNILEDPREERYHIACWPGARKPLDDLPEILRKRDGAFPVLTKDMPPSTVLTSYTLYYARARVRKQKWFEALVAESRPAAVEVLGEGVIGRLEGLIEIEGPAMRDSNDTIELAKRVRSMLEDEAQDPPTDQTAPDDGENSDDTESSSNDQAADDGKTGEDAPGADDSDEANSGDDSSRSDGDDTSDEGSDANDNGDAESDSSGDGDDDSDAGASAAAGGDHRPSDAQREAIRNALADQDAANMAKDLGDEIQDALKSAIQEIDPTGYGEKAESSEVDIAEALGVVPPEYMPNGSFSPVKGLVTSGQLRAVLRERFRTLTTAKHDESRRGSRLNQRRVHRLSTGDARVFIRTTDRRELDTAVFLLADVSGSMSTENRIGIASDAMLCTAAALTGLPGVKVAAGTFPGLFPVLKFGENPLTNTPRFGLPCFGTTPMAEGLRWATSVLSTRSEARKILLVMTDGEPDNRGTASTAIQAAEAIGIEVMAIGIKHSGVETLFSDSVVITDLPELPRAMMSMLGSTLEASLAA